MNRGMKVGIAFTVVPIVIIAGYLGWLLFIPSSGMFYAMAPLSRGLEGGGGSLSITDHTAQLLVGAGTCFMSVCYGIAKIIRELRRK